MICSTFFLLFILKDKQNNILLRKLFCYGAHYIRQQRSSNCIIFWLAGQFGPDNVKVCWTPKSKSIFVPLCSNYAYLVVSTGTGALKKTPGNICNTPTQMFSTWVFLCWWNFYTKRTLKRLNRYTKIGQPNIMKFWRMMRAQSAFLDFYMSQLWVTSSYGPFVFDTHTHWPPPIERAHSTQHQKNAIGQFLPTKRCTFVIICAKSSNIILFTKCSTSHTTTTARMS